MGAVARFGVLFGYRNRDLERGCCVYICEDIKVIGDIDIGTAIDEGVMCSNGAGVVEHATYSGLACNV